MIEKIFFPTANQDVKSIKGFFKLAETLNGIKTLLNLGQ